MSNLQDAKLEDLITDLNSYIRKVRGFKYYIKVGVTPNTLSIRYTVILKCVNKFKHKRDILIKNVDLNTALVHSIAELESLIEVVESKNRISYIFNY